MILSERGAICSGIADGGFHLYPAGKLMNIIKTALPCDELKSNFDPAATVEKISAVSGPGEAVPREIFEKDRKTLCERLSKMSAEYDIASAIDGIIVAIPALAKRYYGIDGFEAPRPKIVEYYFEGFNDLYKDGDWTAFNVNKYESVEMKVPVGTYFKRDQVTPGQVEYVALHEANHAMQEIVSLPEGFHSYVPWLDEGMADIIALMMLFRARGDEQMLAKIKGNDAEIGVTKPRRRAYLYGMETVAMIFLRGRLPFVKALMRAQKREFFSINWNLFSVKIKAGWDPHIALITAYTGERQDAFRKHIERDEARFRKDADLDQSDLRVLQMFLSSHPPTWIDAAQYSAALWLMDELQKTPSPHFVDPAIIPAAMRSQIPGWNENSLVPAAELPQAIWKKVPAISIKVVIKEETVPPEMKAGVNQLAANFFIVKRQIGDSVVYEPYGGGLPYRLGTGEIRCEYS